MARFGRSFPCRPHLANKLAITSGPVASGSTLVISQPVISCSGIKNVSNSTFLQTRSSISITLSSKSTSASTHLRSTTQCKFSGSKQSSASTYISLYTSIRCQTLVGLSFQILTQIRDTGTKKATGTTSLITYTRSTSTAKKTVSGSIIIRSRPELVVTSVTTIGQVLVYNGTSWVAHDLKVWNGSSWVSRPVKYWNGSSWILV